MNLDSVTFWLNAFIPNSVCVQKNELFILPIPNQVGNTPIPALRFFAGDQREFFDDISASSRIPFAAMSPQ